MPWTIQFPIWRVYKPMNVTGSRAMREYRETPTEFHAPTPAELKARNKRNIGIALALAIFMVFVFVTMVARGVIPNVS